MQVAVFNKLLLCKQTSAFCCVEYYTMLIIPLHGHHVGSFTWYCPHNAQAINCRTYLVTLLTNLLIHCIMQGPPRVLFDQMKISNESWAPALTSSPLKSTAREENCTGRGEVNVLKLRYLCTQRNAIVTENPYSS